MKVELSIRDDRELKNHIKNRLVGLRDAYNKEIKECNNFLNKKGDVGQTHRADDPYEIISYIRGKSIGLIIARDKLNKLISELEAE